MCEPAGAISLGSPAPWIPSVLQGQSLTFWFKPDAVLLASEDSEALSICVSTEAKLRPL